MPTPTVLPRDYILPMKNSLPSPLYFVKRGDLVDADSIIMIKMVLSRRFLVSILKEIMIS
jgi:hypothetical protein